MSENTTQESAGTEPKKKKAAPAAAPKPEYSRKTLKSQWRKKIRAKLQAEPEFAKTYFSGKSKRSADRKLAYRKRHSGKKAG